MADILISAIINVELKVPVEDYLNACDNSKLDTDIITDMVNDGNIESIEVGPFRIHCAYCSSSTPRYCECRDNDD